MGKELKMTEKEANGKAVSPRKTGSEKEGRLMPIGLFTLYKKGVAFYETNFLEENNTLYGALQGIEEVMNGDRDGTKLNSSSKSDSDREIWFNGHTYEDTEKRSAYFNMENGLIGFALDDGDYTRLLEEYKNGFPIYARVDEDAITYINTQIYLNMGKKKWNIKRASDDEPIGLMDLEYMESLLYGERKKVWFYEFTGDDEGKPEKYPIECQLIGDSVMFKRGTKSYFVARATIEDMIEGERDKGVSLDQRVIDLDKIEEDN